MKIRLGFVSNSSSSSFCIVGSRIEDLDLIQNKFKDVFILGKSLNEGQDYFKLTKEIYEIIKEHRAKGDLYEDFSYFKVMLEGEDGFTIKKTELLRMLQNMPDEIEFYPFTIDYGYTENVDDFEKRYIKGGEEYED